MTEVTDRRQQKTRAALLAAFRELLLTEGYDALTIHAVTTLANVGRSTFYEHYRTKDDLLRASIHSPFTRLADLVHTPAHTPVHTPASPDALRALLLHFRENQQLARVLLGWPTRPVLASALADMIAARLQAMPQLQPCIPLAVIARQIADAQLALLETWIAGRPAFGIEAAIDALSASTLALVKALCRVS